MMPDEMLTGNERHIRLDGAFNVRDLGGYPTARGGTTRWRSFLRADALHELTEQDVSTLLSIDLRTVIDLRSDAELAYQPSVFARHERVRYHHIPLFDGLAPADFMLGLAETIDLSHRYIEAVDTCRPALLRVADTIAESDDGVVLFNCTAGKDRTGIVAAMLLALAGVAHEDIAADYALTGELAGPFIDRLTARALARGLEPTIAAKLLSSERSAMLSFMRHIEQQHAGFHNYLGTALSAQISAIEDRLLRS